MSLSCTISEGSRSLEHCIFLPVLNCSGNLYTTNFNSSACILSVLKDNIYQTSDSNGFKIIYSENPLSILN